MSPASWVVFWVISTLTGLAIHATIGHYRRRLDEGGEILTLGSILKAMHWAALSVMLILYLVFSFGDATTPGLIKLAFLVNVALVTCQMSVFFSPEAAEFFCRLRNRIKSTPHYLMVRIIGVLPIFLRTWPWLQRYAIHLASVSNCGGPSLPSDSPREQLKLACEIQGCKRITQLFKVAPADVLSRLSLETYGLALLVANAPLQFWPHERRAARRFCRAQAIARLNRLEQFRS